MNKKILFALLISIVVLLQGCSSNSQEIICEPDDENKYYVAELEECSLIEFVCEDDETGFSDDCGCGCEKIEKNEGNSSQEVISKEIICESDDENKYYVTNLEQCAYIEYVCEDNEKMFEDSCGCGCEKIS